MSNRGEQNLIHQLRKSENELYTLETLSVKKSAVMRNALGNCQEISDLAQHDVRGKSLKSIHENYEALPNLWMNILRRLRNEKLKVEMMWLKHKQKSLISPLKFR